MVNGNGGLWALALSRGEAVYQGGLITTPASYSEEMKQLKRNQPGKVNLILSRRRE